MVVARGNPLNVRQGPGKLYMAALNATEPADLATAWDAAWALLGYTNEGSNFVFTNTFEDTFVAEEFEPILTEQTRRAIAINFALAELTALNMSRAFNGGTITTPGTGLTQFEPLPAGQYTPVMLGWEAEDALERWVFRHCVQTGNIDIARRQAPNKATIPCSFRVNKPAGAQSFKFIHDTNYTP